MMTVFAFRLSLIALAFCLVLPVTALGVDADGDGHHSIATGGDDCADDDVNRFPGKTEVCDQQAHDEDCNVETFGFKDTDGDGHTDGSCCNTIGVVTKCGEDCDDFRRGVSPDSPEVCNQLDDNCDGLVDDALLVNSYPDLDHDSWGASGVAPVPMCPQDLLISLRSGVQGDCNDKVASIYPGALEACNGLDDNCDGVEDEGHSGVCD